MLKGQAESIFTSRYQFHENENWEGLAYRVGHNAAKVETSPEKQKHWETKFAEVIGNMQFLTGGRILRNSGRPRGTLFNCYVLNIDDSIEDIAYTCARSLILWAEGGGVGFNTSFLRPEDAPILQKGGESSGPMSFLNHFNGGAETIKTGGSRRAAALAMMLVSHPNIFDFMNYKKKKFDASIAQIEDALKDHEGVFDYIYPKLERGELNNFNLSIGVTEQFLEAVEKNGNWDLKFNQKIYRTVKARDIWDMAIENMVSSAEPGLINWDNLRSNNSYYFDPIISTNPCGEVPLPNFGVCCLGSLVLPNFIANKNTNWAKMEEVVHTAIRMLDNEINMNRYVIEEIKKKAFDSRRIGLGVMGLADYLFAKKLRYGSPEAIEETERLMKRIRNFSYEASIKLAEEKGAFPKFEPYLYTKADFVRTLHMKTRQAIKKYGIRNVTINAVAPTGTISLLPEVVSSAEPLPFKAYIRNDQISKRAYIHPLYQKIIENKQATPEWFVDSADISPTDHLDMQVAIQKFTDSAVSKTINMPRGTKPEQLSSLLLEYIRDLKGVTAYVDGTKEGQILVPISKTEARKYLQEGKTKEIDTETVECGTGSCEI